MQALPSSPELDRARGAPGAAAEEANAIEFVKAHQVPPAMISDLLYAACMLRTTQRVPCKYRWCAHCG